MLIAPWFSCASPEEQNRPIAACEATWVTPASTMSWIRVSPAIGDPTARLSLTGPNGDVPGEVSALDRSLVLVPAAPLSPESAYTARLDGACPASTGFVTPTASAPAGAWSVDFNPWFHQNPYASDVDLALWPIPPLVLSLDDGKLGLSPDGKGLCGPLVDLDVTPSGPGLVASPRSTVDLAVYDDSGHLTDWGTTFTFVKAGDRVIVQLDSLLDLRDAWYVDLDFCFFDCGDPPLPKRFCTFLSDRGDPPCVACPDGEPSCALAHLEADAQPWTSAVVSEGECR
jgi:hypothetical protein